MYFDENLKFYIKLFLIFNLALFFEVIYKNYQFIFKKISKRYFLIMNTVTQT